MQNRERGRSGWGKEEASKMGNGALFILDVEVRISLAQINFKSRPGPVPGPWLAPLQSFHAELSQNSGSQATVTFLEPATPVPLTHGSSQLPGLLFF
jgi:hypothetical protein